MTNQTKIDAKSKLEKVMPKWCQYDRKWLQNRAQIGPKIDEKTMRKFNRKLMANILRKTDQLSDQNSKKGRHFGGKTGHSRYFGVPACGTRLLPGR